MRRTMIECIFGDSIGRVSQGQIREVTNIVDDLIDKTTGVQTLIQMVELVKLVEQLGYVKAAQIRTPHEYKTHVQRRP